MIRLGFMQQGSLGENRHCRERRSAADPKRPLRPFNFPAHPAPVGNRLSGHSPHKGKRVPGPLFVGVSHLCVACSLPLPFFRTTGSANPCASLYSPTALWVFCPPSSFRFRRCKSIPCSISEACKACCITRLWVLSPFSR